MNGLAPSSPPPTIVLLVRQHLSHFITAVSSLDWFVSFDWCCSIFYALFVLISPTVHCTLSLTIHHVDRFCNFKIASVALLLPVLPVHALPLLPGPMAQPVPRRAAAWQRGTNNPAYPPPPPAASQPAAYSTQSNGTPQPRPPPQRSTVRRPVNNSPSPYAPSTTSNSPNYQTPPPQAYRTPTKPTPSNPSPYPQSPTTTATPEHAIQIRGRTRTRPTAAAGGGRVQSESPSKRRHAGLCSGKRVVVGLICCFIVFGSLLLVSLYGQRVGVWDGLSRYMPVSQQVSSSVGGVLHQPTISTAIAKATAVEPLIVPRDDIKSPTNEQTELSKLRPSPPNEPTVVVPPPTTVMPDITSAPTVSPPEPVISTAVALSYQPNAVMTSSLFPKTVDGYPVFSPPSSPVYSNFYCIGGRGREGSQGDRSCRWQNLCYRPADDKWLFYQDPKTQGDMPVLLDHGVVVTEFPKQFVNLRSTGNGYWAPTQVYDAVPTEAMVPRRVTGRADVYLLYHQHNPSNYGHVLGDDFFPLFNLQLSFNMLSNTAQLLMSRSCDADCHKLMQTLTPGMSDRPYLAATQADLRERLGMKTDAEVVCFENVLTGIGPWGFQQSLGKAPTWWQYHAFYLSNMGFSYNHTPKKHRITVSIKDGKRSLYNSPAVVDHLHTAFPDYEIVAVELYGLGGWKAELAYLRDTTVLITPCGGVSMSSMFLPHGSAMIVVDFWDVSRNNSKGMEERLWSNLGYVRSFHYPFVESEVVLEEAGRQRTVYQDMRDWGRVRVDVVRMENLVRAAIAHVDSFMVMGVE